jgi:gas vesicle protein
MNKFLAAFLLGAAAGAAVALAYAPQSGAKTRKQLKRNFDDATDFVRERTEDFSGQAEKIYRRGRSAAEDFVSTARKAARKVSDLA